MGPWAKMASKLRGQGPTWDPPGPLAGLAPPCRVALSGGAAAGQHPQNAALFARGHCRRIAYH